jgi:ribose 5-phosphate isomerase B
LKEELKKYLKEQGHICHDYGAYSKDSCDYPDLAFLVALSVGRGDFEAGIIVDGAGIGSAMAANKVPGVRAAVCNDIYTARNSREHNHANVLTLGSMVVGSGKAKEILKAWLATPWDTGGRHQRRVDKIMDIEKKYLKYVPEKKG